MRIYVQAYATVCVARCIRWRIQKDLEVFRKARCVFLKLHHLFQKARCVFHVGADGSIPSLDRSFPLLRSSLHFNQSALAIRRLKMTAHPFILPSAVLSKSLHNLPSAIPCVFSIHLFSLPLQKMKALSKKLKSWKKFHKWKEAERTVTRSPFTIGIPINRAF